MNSQLDLEVFSLISVVVRYDQNGGDLSLISVVVRYDQDGGDPGGKSMVEKKSITKIPVSTYLLLQRCKCDDSLF